MQCVHGPCCLILPCSLYIPSPLVLYTFLMCYLQVKPPPRDWRTLGKCQKVIRHRPGGGKYGGMAVNSEGLLSVTDDANKCVHLLSKNGALVRSIGEQVLGRDLCGVAFDLEGNIWVADRGKHEVLKLSQNGQLLHIIHHVGSTSDGFRYPTGVSVSPEGMLYICDHSNNRVTVHDEEGKFLFSFGSRGRGPGCFDRPHDITFGSGVLVYVTDEGNKRVSVWTRGGTFKRDFKTKYSPCYISATVDNHLLITSLNTVMVCTLEGELVHEFGGSGSDLGGFMGPEGICVDEDGLVYVADWRNSRVQVF